MEWAFDGLSTFTCNFVAGNWEIVIFGSPESVWSAMAMAMGLGMCTKAFRVRCSFDRDTCM